jgi:ribosomal-protein-alanine N-acetyltransferase
MIGFFGNLFSHGEPALSEASARDSAAIAVLHATSFRRGWNEQEVEGLLIDRHMLTHRAARRRRSGDPVGRRRRT